MCLCLWWTHELAFSFRLKEKGWKGKRFRNTVKEGTIRKVSPKFSCLNEFLLGLSLPSHNSTGLGHASCLVPYSLPPPPRQQPATCGGGTVVVAHTCHSSSQGAKQKPKWHKALSVGMQAGGRAFLACTWVLSQHSKNQFIVCYQCYALTTLAPTWFWISIPISIRAVHSILVMWKETSHPGQG